MCKLRPIRSSSSPSDIAWSAKNIQESTSTRSFTTAKTWASKGMHQSTCTLWALVLRLSFWPFLNQVPKSHTQSVFQPYTALVQSLTTTCSKTSLSPFLFLFETMKIHETSWFLFVSEASITAGLGFWLYLVYWSDQYYSISSSACSFACCKKPRLLGQLWQEWWYMMIHVYIQMYSSHLKSLTHVVMLQCKYFPTGSDIRNAVQGTKGIILRKELHCYNWLEALSFAVVQL